jgi:hypothetical protein
VSDATALDWNPGRPPERRPWGRADAVALAAWTVAIALFFWDAVAFRGAFFYFDITEINYPYRDFFANELKAGRLSMWHPGLYDGLPLFSESQAGYFHPLKFVLYPWLPTWKAFNLDMVLSVWLAGVFTYGWLRRHAGAAGALTGAGVFALSGYTWAHLVHTSMLNALATVPLAFWAIEVAWEGGRFRGVVVAAVALACQVFAGHLQDTILTGLALGVYGSYRASVERGRGRRAWAIGAVVLAGLLAVALSAVQWVPSKELIDRTPREALTWGELTYGSWSPELLPTVLLREAYGTRARDTDWMDGFYPYHEMNVYLGVVGLVLALLGMGAHRDRWVGGWIVLGGVGLLLMFGRFTFLMDHFHQIPLIGRGRVPVRFHLWVAVSAAALSAEGVDRLARSNDLRLRGPTITLGLLALVSVAILASIYDPAFSERGRWTSRYHVDRYRWLGEELTWGAVRTGTLAMLALGVLAAASRQSDPKRRTALTSALPILAIADLLGAHWNDAPTIDPSYWTDPPPSARQLRAEPGTMRVFGEAKYASGEPGYASHRVDFFEVRELLAWSLPPVWGLPSTGGQTPILPRRRLTFTASTQHLAGREVEGLSHIVAADISGKTRLPSAKVGSVYLMKVPDPFPRARLMGRPLYVASESEAAEAMRRLGPAIRDQLVVEDPDRPIPRDTVAGGSARIVREVPDRVEVAVDAEAPAYLLLADSFDPGWSATLDGRPAPIRPAYAAFRAVAVPAGPHEVVFNYRPAGFLAGLTLTGFGCLVALVLWLGPIRAPRLGSGHGETSWPTFWPWAWLVLMLLVVAASIPRPTDRGLAVQDRWRTGFHHFTWGAGIEAMLMNEEADRPR